MPIEIPFELYLLERQLRDGGLMAEALHCPELSGFVFEESDREALQAAVRRELAGVLHRLPAALLSGRQIAEPPSVEEVELTLTPPPDAGRAWREPVQLALPVVRWCQRSRQREELHVAHSPDLGVDVVAGSAEELSERLPVELRYALARSHQAVSLEALEGLTRSEALSVVPVSIQVVRETPLEQARREAEPEKVEGVLAQVASSWHALSMPQVWERDDELARLAERLERRSVLLVGPSGVGKTALAQLLCRRAGRFGLAGHSFYATRGSRLVAGMTGFGAWQQQVRGLVEELAGRKAILHLGNLVELDEVGRYQGNAMSIASFLRPAIARGRIKVIVECSEEERARLAAAHSPLLSAFSILTLEEPDEAAGDAILAAEAARLAGRRSGLIEAAERGEIARLHRRFARLSAWPGRPLRFLRRLARRRGSDEEGAVAGDGAIDPIGAFSEETGLPRVLLDPALPLDLAALASELGSQVIGQPRAIEVVVELVAAVKAALVRPGRPIASLLLIGPTGVGKTALARALARFFFSDEKRLTRFDMSEYADPIAVRRLVGGVGGDEGRLTAAVREQPFSLLLLDEIEKAHGDVFDLLLGVLGEGRLTDAAGRRADFSNTVVIMTSNLGARSWQRGSSGFAPGGRVEAPPVAQAEAHFRRAVAEHVRPELFNRIDRIVPFGALTAQVVQRVAEREVALSRRRPGLLERPIELSISDRAVAALAEVGYQPRYGARPLQRAVAQGLLRPIAAALNAADGARPLQLSVDGEDGRELAVEVSPLPRTKPVGERGAVDRLRRLRRKLQRLSGCWPMSQVRSEVTRLTRREAQRARRKYQGSPEEQAKERARLAAVSDQASGVKALLAQAEDLEDDGLARWYAGEVWPDADGHRALAALTQGYRARLLGLARLRHPQPDRALVLLACESVEWLMQLARWYRTALLSGGARVRSRVFVPRVAGLQLDAETDIPPVEPGSAPPSPWAHRDRIARLEGEHILGEDWERDWPADRPLLELALEVRGPGVALRLEQEPGLHIQSALDRVALLRVSRDDLIAYRPPPTILRQKYARQMGAEPARRYAGDTVRDEVLGRAGFRQGAPDLAGLLDLKLERRLEALLER